MERKLRKKLLGNEGMTIISALFAGSMAMLAALLGLSSSGAFNKITSRVNQMNAEEKLDSDLRRIANSLQSCTQTLKQSGQPVVLDLSTGVSASIPTIDRPFHFAQYTSGNNHAAAIGMKVGKELEITDIRLRAVNLPGTSQKEVEEGGETISFSYDKSTKTFIAETSEKGQIVLNIGDKFTASNGVTYYAEEHGVYSEKGISPVVAVENQEIVANADLVLTMVDNKTNATREKITPIMSRFVIRPIVQGVAQNAIHWVGCYDYTQNRIGEACDALTGGTGTLNTDNAMCNYHAGAELTHQSVCESMGGTFTAAPGPEQKRCELPNSGVIQGSAGAPCQNNAQCASGSCAILAAVAGGDGEPNYQPGDEVTTARGTCVGGPVFANGGQPCTVDYNCKSGKCESGVCSSQILTFGDACTSDEQCKSGKCNQSGTPSYCDLREHAAIGQYCYANRDCATNFCDSTSNRCAEEPQLVQ